MPEQDFPEAIKSDKFLSQERIILLGIFLVKAGVFPEATLNTALHMQELVKSGAFTNSQAAEAVRRAHGRNTIDLPLDRSIRRVIEPTQARNRRLEPKFVGPPLGQILVEAGLISLSVLKEALHLQDLIRSGKLSQEDAFKAIGDLHAGPQANINKEDEDSPRINRVIRLLVHAGVLSNQDLIAARNAHHKNGGKVSKILLATHKIDQKLFDSAEECEVFYTEDKIDLTQAIAALQECNKRNVEFKQIAKEMMLPGW